MTETMGNRNPSAWAKFKLLMWKNFLQQWRHKWQTLIEILLPVATMSLVLILRSQIEPVNYGVKTYPALKADSLWASQQVIAGMNITQLSIAYSPENEVLDDVVRSAVVRLFINNLPLIPSIWETIQNTTGLPDLPNIDIEQLLPLITEEVFEVLKRLVRVDAYANSTLLRSIYISEEKTREIVAALEFDDALQGVTVLPNNLSLAFRFPERPRLNSFYRRGGNSWRTANLFPAFELPGPRYPYSYEGGNDPGYVNEMFIALQQVVSSEVISRLTGDNLTDFTVNINRYPHPPYLEDFAVETLKFLFSMFMLLSYSYTAINLVRAITVENEMQLKDTMKIMGLPTWLHWTAWFWKQFIFLLISALLILLILKVNWFSNEEGFGDYAVFTNTPWHVLLFFIVLYLTCTIFFCFMLSGFLKKGGNAALFAGIIWYLTDVPAFMLRVSETMSVTAQVFACFFLNSAMSYGFQHLLNRESTGGVQWGEFFLSPEADSSRFVFGHVVVMMIANCVIYMLIALYLEKVLPGEYGSPEKWYFFVQPSYWKRSRKVSDVVYVAEANSHIDSDQIIKESDPINHNVGVRISGLTKVFGQNTAVNNLSLNIYDDQITVLLGHNGAGKSTTISMLTGSLEATHGAVTVAGYDMINNTSGARAHLGVCPQHNVLFNELTVREHLEFFARLKGFTGQALNEEIDTLISKLELEEKRDYQSQGLSGGQKRRLQVGIALSGGAKVVLLDEPTSGMDPASRRGLWDLLQREKTGRSMILTTHFMDEADILGDRVAIMANGKLQCIGSPYFLKRHYGVGYTLVVVKDEGFQYQTCCDIINKYMLETTIEDRGTEITFSLKNEYSHNFESMFIDLENNQENIRFKNYGLVNTTLEDVFMSVGSDLPSVTLDSDDATITSSEDDDEFVSSLEQLKKSGKEVTGIKLWWLHIRAIWFKLWLVWTRSWMLLLLQILVPILMINATLGVFQYVMSMTESIHRRQLVLNEDFTSTETFLSYNGTTASSLGDLATAAYENMFTSAGISSNQIVTLNASQPIDAYYLERTADPVDMGAQRNRLLIGATFSDDSATAWFSNFGYHDVAISLAAVHSALLKARIPEASFTVFNHPIEATYQDQSNMQVMVTLLSMQLASGIGSSVGIISAVFVIFYIKERVSRAKLLQKASGIQPFIMWISAALFDWLWFCVIALTIIVSCAIFQVVGLSTFDELGRVYFLMMVYGATALPIIYLFSYLFNGPATGFVVLFFVNILFGMMGAQIVEALQSLEDTEHVALILDSILQFFPLYALNTSVRFMNRVGIQEWSCMQFCDMLTFIQPDIEECTMESMCEINDQCCVTDNPYWEWDEPGVMRYVVCMLGTGFVAWIVMMICEYRLPQKIFQRTRQPAPVDKSTLDFDVVDEMRHVERVVTSDLQKTSLVAHGLSKYYDKNLAVDQVAFTVADGECFGLLGVNGAGKTTTFKMLMGDESISYGDAYVGGYSVKTNINKVYEYIGYCPQFDAVFEELTGRETLKFFSMLRGQTSDTLVNNIETIAQTLGFKKHLDKQVKQYSGGNKRKLSTAVAMLGRTKLLFVDEPTTGVDPAARRQVWRAIQGAQRAGRGVVLTSHSMEECEALCSRLTIMVNGRFQCLGTPQHLKNKFSQGFTLTIKILKDEDFAVMEERARAIKNYVQPNFQEPKLMEEYEGLLTYYVWDRTLAWSHMFGVMERAKHTLNIENYTISQTTLEQIFLQFTKYQRVTAPSS